MVVGLATYHVYVPIMTSHPARMVLRAVLCLYLAHYCCGTTVPMWPCGPHTPQLLLVHGQ